MPKKMMMGEDADRKTMIELTVETRERLKTLGRKGETYETIIRRLIGRGDGNGKTQIRSA